jgi:2'-5' RNA ligase
VKSETELLMGMKGKPFSHLCDRDWVCSFAFCIDTIQRMNEHKVQEANHCISEMCDKVTAFQRKLGLWELQLRSKNVTLFPILGKEKLIDAKKYAEEIQLLQEELNSVFQDIGKYEAILKFHCHLTLILKLLELNFNWR